MKNQKKIIPYETQQYSHFNIFVDHAPEAASYLLLSIWTINTMIMKMQESPRTGV